MLMQDICANGEPEAHALGLGGDERMEEAGALLGGDAGTVVGYLEDDAATGRIPGAELHAALAVLVLEGLEGVN
jgi:hypothetical protein